MSSRKKEHLNISIYPDTKDRLLQYADEQRKSVSQVIEEWTWAAKLKGKQQLRGQTDVFRNA